MKKLRPLASGLVIGLLGLAAFILLPPYLMHVVQVQGEDYLASVPSYESIRDADTGSYTLRVWEAGTGQEKVIAYTGRTGIFVLPQYTVYFAVRPDGSYRAFTDRWKLGRIIRGEDKE